MTQDLLVELKDAFCWMIRCFFERLDISPQLGAVFVSLDPIAVKFWVRLVACNMLLKLGLITAPILLKSGLCFLNVLFDAVSLDLAKRTSLNEISLLVSGCACDFRP